jgi:hypothetical protein
MARAGGELDAPGLGDQGRQEQHAVGDVLALVGQVLAHEGVVEAQAVGEDDGLAILAQGLAPVAVHGMHRHREVAQPHARSRSGNWHLRHCGAGHG